MSNIAIKGATTGTGTFTIESPATNTDRTLTLPDEAGTVVTTGGANNVSADMLASTLDLSGKTVTLPSGVGGKVLQVIQDTNVGGNSTSSTTYQSCGLSASITPTSTSNKILILSNSVIDCNSGRSFGATIFKDGTDMAANVGNGNEGFIGAEDTGRSVSSIMYLDSPSTTNATTYEIKFRSKNGTTVEFPPFGSITTTLILMEIA